MAQSNITSDPADNLQVFCRTVTSRSRENLGAFYLLFQEKHYGNALSIIGQEIDSMIRVMYLLTISDLAYRQQLIDDAVDGKQWKHRETGKRITDREMVEVSTKSEFWVREAYKIRNGVIHLSRLHDYKERDALSLIPKEDKREIIKHLRRWHNGPHQKNPTFQDVIPYLPKVLHKMQDHLKGYVDKLGGGSGGTFLPLNPDRH